MINPTRLCMTAFLMLIASLPAQIAPRSRPTSTRLPPRTTGRSSTAAPAAAGTSAADVTKQLAEAEKNASGRPKLKFDNAPADLFLQIYAQVTKRTLLMSPDVPKVTITMKSNDEDSWSDEEYLQALQTQLQLNGISIIPTGERFLLVTAFKTVGQMGIETFLDLPPSGKHPEEGKVVRQIITPKNISAEEAQKAIESFKRADGQIQFLERTNSLLITDAQSNVNRMIDIIDFIDKPMPVLEEVEVRSLKFAKVEDIKTALEEFVAESQKQEEEAKQSVAAPQIGNSLSGGMQRGRSRPSRLPGVTRAEPELTAASPTFSDALVNEAHRGMIRGKVQIMADERSNQLIIVTRPANMQFFDRIITVLDIETAPEIAVEVIRLKYASAESKDGDTGIAELLNELIDASSSSKKDDSTVKQGTAAGTDANLTTPTPREPSRAARAAESNLSSTAKSKLGELSKDNIKILPDPRINAIMVMASPGDLAAIKEIVESMDIPVAQVLIETVIIEVALDESFETGLDWVKRVSGSETAVGAGGGGSSDFGSSSSNLFGDVITPGGENSDGTSKPDIVTPVAKDIARMTGGMQLMATFDKINLDVVLKAQESDNRSKLIASPIIMTQDNKEATIESTELQYLYNGMKYMGSSYGGSDYQPDIKQQDVGLTVKITPRINPDGTVVLNVEQSFENADKTQVVPGSGMEGASSSWPVITRRKITADVSLQHGQTVVIGGLVQNSFVNNENGIPFLRDIPYVGKYLFGSTSRSEKRSELLVFLTPYVFTTPEQAAAEARRRKDYINAAGVWNQGWSSSALADDVDEVNRLRRTNESRAYEDKQFEAKIKRGKADFQHNEKMLNRLERDIAKSNDLLENENLTEAQRVAVMKKLANEKVMYEAMRQELELE